MAQDVFKEQTPLRQEFTAQLEELMKTGGIEAALPILQVAMERSRRAESDTLRSLDERLAQMDLAGTPYGERVRAETASQGRQQTSQIPTAFYQMFLQMLPGFLTGQQSNVTAGFSQAAQSGLGRQQVGGRLGESELGIWGKLVPSLSMSVRK